MDERMRKALEQRIDGVFTSAITDTTTTNAAPTEPLTLDKLRRLMLSMPPKETWLASRIFPSDRAWMVKGAGENFTCAHPSFWAKLEDHLRKTAEPAPLATNNLGINLAPIEIDRDEGDTPDRAEWKRAHWGRLSETVRVAMVPLPDWLRAAPEFGSFG